MISRAYVDKLLGMQAAGPSLLSLYLWIPLDPAELRGLSARADELFALAARDASEPGSGRPVRLGPAERDTVRRLLTAKARDWMGHTVAIFACVELGLNEAVPLPTRLQERAILATRPHVRPLLLAIQRCPAYRVVVADRRHAWLFSITGDEIRTAALPDAAGVRSHGFSGWYGLEAHRVNERVINLARHHYHDTAALLDRATRADGPEPLVIGGHEETIPEMLAALPVGLRDQVAGSFVVDPHILTPAKVRDLADRVIEGWLGRRDQQLLDEIRQEPPDGLAVTGLTACLDAARQHAIRLLAGPAGGLLPGYVCQRCGALSSDGDGCADGREASRPVPDLIEELTVRTLEDGGQVHTLRDPPAGIAALLRFPLAPA
jgi:Bacterial archaeo-eukaryotic release factor family 10